MNCPITLIVRGDIIRLETPGARGFGRLQAREAALIERDLVEGFVTQEGMRKAQSGPESGLIGADSAF